MEKTGRITYIGDIRKGVAKTNGKEWIGQDFVIEYPSGNGYTSKLAFTILGLDNITAAAIRMGDYVAVTFDICAHEYRGKWYNEVRAWKVAHVGDPRNEAQTSNSNGGGGWDPATATYPTPTEVPF